MYSWVKELTLSNYQEPMKTSILRSIVSSVALYLFSLHPANAKEEVKTRRCQLVADGVVLLNGKAR